MLKVNWIKLNGFKSYTEKNISENIISDITCWKTVSTYDRFSYTMVYYW